MKRLSILGVTIVCATCAFADFLYWQIPEGSGEFTTAAIYAISGDHTDEKLTDTTGAVQLDEYVADGVDFENNMTGTSLTGPITTDISGYGSTYSFFVELLTYGSDGNVTGTNRLLAYSYDTLLNNGYIDAGAGLKPVAGGSTNFSMTHVPEPSSGLLMLLGGALMALRRRRRA